ncbi:hypothetical protein K523DRAFT_418070 [Schizophyllum commune Tattone D]|nr:hypothetical protein K525DRAFT_234693 [Schizophyllum commune Loenen D]KAI5827903.1 hypothetical protein K523DRAFT_418070 [Schizophyllum commune Tattone D]
MSTTATSSKTLGDAIVAGERTLSQLTIPVRDVVPRHVNLKDRSVKHCYARAPTTYLLGYFISPKKLYENLKKKGKAEATMQATLDKYLAYIKRQCGITWGDGLKREISNDEEVWLFWMAESLRKEDIYAVELEEIAGFRRLLGSGRDPTLITYEHPKLYIC